MSPGERDEKTRRVVSRPLHLVSEVLAWEPNGDKLCQSRVPLHSSYAASISDGPKLLVCHDMQGGYLNDRFVEGCSNTDTYRFSHWWLVDLFVYFSHHFVTIPPPCWIDSGHKHGVRVLGTLITEPSEDTNIDGEMLCEEIFSTEQTYKDLAHKLVKIASYYRFDGWLLNIENKIRPELMSNVVAFVDYLTQAMHRSIGHSQVIWYDSVTKDGRLKWQDQLNGENKCFFDRCDGIFLNYGWDRNKLITSCEAATPDVDAEAVCPSGVASGKNYDVYVGCDVFGRGCLGGGQFNTREALQVAVECKLSGAIFAPGWTYECLDKLLFTSNEIKFWGLLAEFTRRRCLTQLPVVTNFCQGWGYQYMRDGETVSSKPWTSLSLQQIQPMLRYSAATEESMCNVEYTAKDAFIGGGCLSFTSNPASSGATTKQLVKIFSVEGTITDDLMVSYTLKAVSINAKFSILLQYKSSNDEMRRAFNLVGPSELNVVPSIAPIFVGQVETIHPILDNLDTKSISSLSNGWSTRSYILRGLKNCILLGVSAVVSADMDQCYEVNLGQIKIIPVEYSRSMESICSTTLRTQKGFIHTSSVARSNADECPQVTIMLSWNVPNEFVDIVSHYYITALYPLTAVWKFLGVSPRNCCTQCINVNDDLVEFLAEMKFKVEAVLFIGDSFVFDLNCKIVTD